MGQARKVLLAGTLLALVAGGALAMTRPELPASLAQWRETLEALLPDRAPASPARMPAPRTAVEDGRTIVHLTSAERARVGIVTQVLHAQPHPRESTATAPSSISPASPNWRTAMPGRSPPCRPPEPAPRCR